jgi:hypothetical protein
MKLRLSILLLAAAALAAAPAAGQTIKSLGYNTTNGNIVAATNVTFTNSVGFATNARATTRTNLGLGGGDSVTFSNLSLSGNGSLAIGGMNVTAITSGIDLAFKRAGSTELELKTNGLVLHVGSYSFSGGNTNGVSTTRTNLGLGGTNTPTFSNIQLNSFPGGGSTGFVGHNSGVLALYGTNVSTSVPAFYGYDGFNNTAFSASTARTNLELGATNNVTFSNVTASGTLTATGNATLNGVNNTMPNATNAASGASLMTRDLADARLGNPESTFNTTYWFGLEGLGNWITAGTGPVTIPTSGGGAGLNTTLTLYTSARIGTNHAGAAIQSPPDNLGGGNMWRPSDGNNVTFRLRIRKGGVTSQPAFAFILGGRLQSSMWAVNTYGLFFVPQPTNSWTASTAYLQHDRISVSNVVWAVNTAGTTDTNAPTWTDLIGSLATNGTAVFRNCGPHTSNNWVLAIGHTNASQVVMTNTGKSTWQTNNRTELNLKLRGVQSSAPYTIFASVQDGTSESAEVSLSHSNNNPLGPQMWQRWEQGASGDAETVSIRYIGIQGTLPPLF